MFDSGYRPPLFPRIAPSNPKHPAHAAQNEQPVLLSSTVYDLMEDFREATYRFGQETDSKLIPELYSTMQQKYRELARYVSTIEKAADCLRDKRMRF